MALAASLGKRYISVGAIPTCHSPERIHNALRVAGSEDTRAIWSRSAPLATHMGRG